MCLVFTEPCGLVRLGLIHVWIVIPLEGKAYRSAQWKWGTALFPSSMGHMQTSPKIWGQKNSSFGILTQKEQLLSLSYAWKIVGNILRFGVCVVWHFGCELMFLNVWKSHCCNNLMMFKVWIYNKIKSNRKLFPVFNWIQFNCIHIFQNDNIHLNGLHTIF